jgi:hypothetical protein
MKAGDIVRILNGYNKTLNGMTIEQIEYEMNERAEHNDGSLIDGIKIGYLYSILYNNKVR